MKIALVSAVLLLAGIGVSACQALPPAAVPLTLTVAPPASSYIPDLGNGEAAWESAQCNACHGPTGLGGVGPQLAATQLSFGEFVEVVRTAVLPKPAYDEASLPSQTVNDIYAWMRTQRPPAQADVRPAPTPAAAPDVERMMSMTIWSCKKCSTCHGVFAQGSATAPALAEISESEETILNHMRSTAVSIPEHGADNIADDIFGTLYEWLRMGCLTSECSQ